MQTARIQCILKVHQKANLHEMPALNMRSAKELQRLGDFIFRPPSRACSRTHFVSLTSSMLNAIHAWLSMSAWCRGGPIPETKTRFNIRRQI